MLLATASLMNQLDLDNIIQHVESRLELNGVTLRDDSHLHRSHLNFQAQKAYLTITLANHTSLSRIQFHKQVYQLVEEACPIPIHALCIKLV